MQIHEQILPLIRFHPTVFIDIMDSDDENLIIPPEHLNLSDEALPELQLDEGGAVGGATGDDDVGDGAMISDGNLAKNNPRFDTEWDTFQMSIAR